MKQYTLSKATVGGAMKQYTLTKATVFKSVS